MVTAGEWETVEKGVQQRVKVLAAFLADVYGEQRVIKDGIVPRRVVVSSSAHCRAHEAYLRTYRAAVEPEKVVELLVMDRALSG